MNTTIETILAHRSVRKFKKQPLTTEQIETIVRCAQSASTSSFIQAYTIIGVTDTEKKQKLAELSGNQSYVAENGHFLYFAPIFIAMRLLVKSKEETSFLRLKALRNLWSV